MSASSESDTVYNETIIKTGMRVGPVNAFSASVYRTGCVYIANLLMQGWKGQILRFINHVFFCIHYNIQVPSGCKAWH